MSLLDLPTLLPKELRKNVWSYLSLLADFLTEDLRFRIWDYLTPADRLFLVVTCRPFLQEVETLSKRELDNMLDTMTRKHGVDGRDFLFRAGMNAIINIGIEAGAPAADNDDEDDDNNTGQITLTAATAVL